MLKEGTKLNEIMPGAMPRPIIPTSFDDALRMANLAVISGLFKPARNGENGNSGDKETQAQATMAILQGMEVGIPPIQALQGITIINGRATIWGDLIPALLWSRGFEIDEIIENEDAANMRAVCTVTRPNGKKIVRRFSVNDAMQAGLWQTSPTIKKKFWDKNKKAWGPEREYPNDSPWFKYGKRMLAMRARGFASRDGAPDVMRGLYMREELEDALRSQNAIDVTPAKSSLIPTKAFVDPTAQTSVSAANDSAPVASAEASLPFDIPDVPDEAPAQSEEDVRLHELDNLLSKCGSENELHDVWGQHLEAISELGRTLRPRADQLFEAHLDRVSGGLSSAA
jgi:hypothetical protein